MSGDRPPIRPAARVAARTISRIRQMMNLAPPGAINLGIGQTNQEVPLPLRDALQRAPSATAAPYTLNAGLPELRARIAERYAADPSQVLVTVGVQEGLALAVLGTVDPGDEVAVPDPGFSVYPTLAELAGAVPVGYRLGPDVAFRPTWAAIEAALSPRTRLVILNSPANPSGAVSSPDEWTRILRGLRDVGVAYLSDEIYLSFQNGAARHPSAWAVSGLGVVAAGLSKSHSIAGWRLGWLVLPPELVEPLTALHQQLVTSAATPVQEAALSAFTPESARLVEALCAMIDAKRLRARTLLERRGWTVASGDGAMYLLVRWPGVDDDVALAMHLLHDCSVITIPGSAFGAGGRGYLRLSYAVEVTELGEAVERITRSAARFAANGPEAPTP